jgi:hypothetical protein
MTLQCFAEFVAQGMATRQGDFYQLSIYLGAVNMNVSAAAVNGANVESERFQKYGE